MSPRRKSPDQSESVVGKRRYPVEPTEETKEFIKKVSHRKKGFFSGLFGPAGNENKARALNQITDPNTNPEQREILIKEILKKKK